MKIVGGDNVTHPVTKIPMPLQELIRDIKQTHKNTFIHERISVLNWTFWLNEGELIKSAKMSV